MNSSASSTAATSVLGTRTRNSLEYDPGYDRAPGLHAGPRKKMKTTDALTHSGRHFARAIYAFTDVRYLIAQGFKRTIEMAQNHPEDWGTRARQEYAVYKRLLELCDGLEERLAEATSPEEIHLIADLPPTQIQKGSSGARADDTKGMKAAIVDWITPTDGHLTPPIHRRSKTNRGFHHQATGSLLCPAGLDWTDKDIQYKLGTGEKIVAGHHWPIFIYSNLKFDPNDPWKGLLRNELLIKVNSLQLHVIAPSSRVPEGFKHVFIAPSAADLIDGSTTTRSGNARIHGMKEVTKASIVYVATQVRFALTSASQWSRSDKITDSENFYTSLLDTLEDPSLNKFTMDLLAWWNMKIFPHHIPETSIIPVTGSPLDRIRQMAAEARIQESSGSN
ncbi:hypothetical protein DXG01_005285 [Tephrocybe rancida]|nr:hypothetical protein DXG01_005285 [Tephrocybe rancida]